MNGIVTPNANVIYSAVGSVITGTKIEEFAPKNDKEWQAVGDSAAAIVESGNMLLVGDRLIDTARVGVLHGTVHRGGKSGARSGGCQTT